MATMIEEVSLINLLIKVFLFLQVAISDQEAESDETNTIRNELIEMLVEGFVICADRFLHYKALFRMAQCALIHRSRHDIACSIFMDRLFRGRKVGDFFEVNFTLFL
jgi:hypothetical protein